MGEIQTALTIQWNKKDNTLLVPETQSL
ncbi:hypothetical protein [Candidatus Coxiella mudrowiae]